MTVIDWNACSAGHGGWFGPDGLHLSGEGAQGLAHCMHDAVLRVLNAPPPPPPIEVEFAFPAGVTVGFHATLEAHGGKAPYRYAVRGLPPGLHATRAGAIAGTLEHNGSYILRVTVTDAAGVRVTAPVPLTVS
jgi:hypothetical protein